MLKWHGPGSPCGRRPADAAPGPFNFRGCRPGAALIFSTCAFVSHFAAFRNLFPISRAPAVRQSLQNSARLGRHQGGLPFFWGRGRQAKHLPCKQAHVGALPTGSTISNCGKLDQSTERSLINFFRWVQLPLPLPFHFWSSLGTNGNRSS